MDVNNLINEFVQNIVFPYFLGWITEGICLVSFVIAIFVLIIIMRQKRKSQLQSPLIYYNQKPKAEIQTTEQWEKAKVHIEKLLYEITENRQISDFLEGQSKNSDQQVNYEIIGHKQNELISENQNEQENSQENSNQPLNVHELRVVATLAKQLQTRNQPRISK